MYACKHRHTHTHAYTRTHAHRDTHMRTCMHTYTGPALKVLLNSYVWAAGQKYQLSGTQIYTYTHRGTHTQRRADTHTCMHAHTHTHTHTHNAHTTEALIGNKEKQILTNNFLSKLMHFSSLIPCCTIEAVVSRRAKTNKCLPTTLSSVHSN